jgi:hypothetical protein
MVPGGFAGVLHRSRRRDAGIVDQHLHTIQIRSR